MAEFVSKFGFYGQHPRLDLPEYNKKRKDVIDKLVKSDCPEVKGRRIPKLQKLEIIRMLDKIMATQHKTFINTTLNTVEYFENFSNKILDMLAQLSKIRFKLPATELE